MADYLGIDDNIQPLQEFNPNLNFYSNVLGTKQQQYDQGMSRLKSIYGSAFNMPLTRDDNIQRREGYFRTITDDLKKIAASDLSVDQNISQAKQLFKPILQDKYIVQDMAFTNKLHDSYSRAEQFRYCSDPEKCGGEFSQTGLDALNYRAREFKQAHPDRTLSMSGPDYVPDQPVFKKAMAAMKDAGFSITQETIQGGYIVKDTNGNLLYGKDGQGILPQFLSGMFGNDPAVQAMYQTRAYVHQNRAIDELVARGMDRVSAEAQYGTEFVVPAIAQINRVKQAYDSSQETMDTEAKAIQVAQQQGKTTPGDGADAQYNKLQALLEQSKAAGTVIEKQQDVVRTGYNLNTPEALRDRAQAIMAAAFMHQDLDKAAYTYSMGTAKREINADPYSMAAYTHRLDLGNALALQKNNHQYEMENIFYRHTLEMEKENAGNLGALALARFAQEKGIPLDDFHKQGITTLKGAEGKKALELGLATKEDVRLAATKISPSDDSQAYQNTWLENQKVLTQSLEQSNVVARDYLGNTLSGMVQAYKQADADTPDIARDKKRKLRMDAFSILKGTGINPDALLRGEVSPEKIKDIQDVSGAASTALSLRNNNAGARIYTDGMSDEALARVQTSLQATQGIQNRITQDIQNARSRVMATIPVNDPEQLRVLQAMIQGDRILSPTEAAKRYFNSAHRDYASRGIDPTHLPLAQMFDSHYLKLSEAMNANMKTLDAPAGVSVEGGQQATKNAVMITGEADRPYTQNSVDVKSVMGKFANDLSRGNLYFLNAGGNREVTSQYGTDPAKRELFQKMWENIGTKGAKIQMESELIPGWFEPNTFGSKDARDAVQRGDDLQGYGTMHPDRIRTDFKISEDTYRDFMGLKKSDPVTQSDLTVQVISDADHPGVAPFVSRLRKQPNQMYINQPGASYTLDFGPKGKAIITNRDGVFYMKTNVPLPSQDDDGNITTVFEEQPEQRLQDDQGQGYDLNKSISVTSSVIAQTYQNFLSRMNSIKKKH